MVPQTGVVSGRKMIPEHHFSGRGTSDAYVLRSIAVSPKPAWFQYTIKVRRHEAIKAAGLADVRDAMEQGA